MRPDRIIVGEVRGAESLDMLQAMNTGHDGSISTVHANSARDSLNRLEMMMQMAGFELPIRAMRQQIALALDVIVATARMNDGTRKITSITEVVGMEGDTVMLQDLFVFQREGTDENGKIIGRFMTTGIRPRFADNLKSTGQSADAQAFEYLRN
jgi:pilus assembly protein CpaF